MSKTCLVRFDNNRYSVSAHAVGRPVEIRAYADRIEIRQDGRVVGDHARSFGRDQTVFDPWHVVREHAFGMTFRCWPANPAHCATARRSRIGFCRPDLSGSGASWPGPPTATAKCGAGAAGMVRILTAVLSDGLPAVEAASQETLREGVHSADVVLNVLSRHREPDPPAPIMTPEALELRHAPVADCTRYDSLRRAL